MPIKNIGYKFGYLERWNLSINVIAFEMALLMLLSLHCSSTKSLSDAEKGKLDPPLIRLFTGEQVDKNLVGETLRPDGAKEYAVIVRSEHSEDIKALGVAVSSVFGDVIVVHATIEELRKIASLPTVRALEAGSKKTIQQSQ
jgi:hypothetical protein